MVLIGPPVGTSRGRVAPGSLNTIANIAPRAAREEVRNHRCIGQGLASGGGKRKPEPDALEFDQQPIDLRRPKIKN
jgi:hypothetical protein